MSDIRFPVEQGIFSVRVAGIIETKEKVFLQKIGNHEFSAIGGHVMTLETTKDALIREYLEELNLEVVCGKLIGVGELFIPDKKGLNHQIAFYYEIQPKNESFYQDLKIRQGFDDVENKKELFEYSWVDKSSLGNENKIYPPILKDILLQEQPKRVLRHFIYHEN